MAVYYVINILLLLSNFSLLSFGCEIFTYPEDAVINRIRLGGLICSLKSFLQSNMCQELQIFAVVYMYWGCKLSLIRLWDSDFGITAVDDITIGITCAAFCFHMAHISVTYYYYYYYYYTLHT